MIGMSLQYRSLLKTKDEQLKPEVILPRLWARGVRSIELRAIKPKDDASDVLRISNMIWDYGFQITVHSTCASVESAVEDVFEPLSELLCHLRQRELVITVHPVVGDNALMLTALSDYVTEHGYPIRIALENNRRMPDGTDGDSLALVLDAVTRADRQNVGTCFDMGHWAWYNACFTDTPNKLPPKKFLNLAIHTHIHALTDGVTHFPLEEWREPYSLYIEALAPIYLGVYNIELTPKRYEERFSASESYLISAETLRAHYPDRAALYNDIRLSYDGKVRLALDALRCGEGSRCTVIAPSSYLFSTNGYRWAVDVSFLHLRELADTPSRIREYLCDYGCMLLTHEHGDHMEEQTIRALVDTDIIWVAPEFLVERMVGFGVRRELIRAVRAGDDIRVGPLRIRVLEGRHFRPGTRSGVRSVGYVVSSENAPTVALPGDVRDYSVNDGEELDADYCFAHVWLTDQALTPEAYIPKCRELASFALSMSRRNIFLTHLYIHRSDEKRWTLKHARAAAEAIFEISPETRVRVPSYGEVFELDQA